MIGKMLGVAAAAAVGVMAALPAHAQTAGDVNRLNAAMQLCNSPAGAAIAECSKLGGMTGGGIGLPGLGRLGGAGGKLGFAAGLLGQAMAAHQQQAAAAAATQVANTPAPAPPLATAPADPAMQQALANCVAGAQGNAQVIQACLSMSSAAAAPAAAVQQPALTNVSASADQVQAAASAANTSAMAERAASAVPAIAGFLSHLPH